MWSLRSSSPWILLSALALLTVCSGARDRSRDKEVTGAPRGDSRPSRGKFNLNSGMQCTWATKDANEEVKMTVKCENPQARIHGGVTDLQCEYRAKPQHCPGFLSNSKKYYKQVSRAIRKLQGKLCYDERALVNVGMCKRAPRDAHFKLDIGTSVVSAQSGEDTLPPRPSARTTTSAPTLTGTPADCKGRAVHQVAQEHCSSQWASVCAFFFSMLQSEEC